jgi:hypothetical protein
MESWPAWKDRIEQAVSGSWESLKFVTRGHHAQAQALVVSSSSVLENTTTSTLSMADLGSQAAERAFSAKTAAQLEWDSFLKIFMTTSPMPLVRGHACYAFIFVTMKKVLKPQVSRKIVRTRFSFP